MWSEAGRMATIVRDCGPARYLFMLSEDFEYYNSKKQSRLPASVLNAFRVQCARESAADEELRKLMGEYKVTEAQVSQWLNELLADAGMFAFAIG